ncbi:alpha/beta hydrolase [Microbulbifer sp.]|uniref:alpha/beta fold hydrolase n=1 Tax=Microbulbifer sp. TaxID=1908541 RepID=UPI00258776C9|nr:alpha/beta hydrolase [Microbulbifer sp.]
MGMVCKKMVSGLVLPALIALVLSVSARATESPFDIYPIHFATIDGTAIAYQDMGPPDGEPVLLIMGLGAQMLHWGDPLVRGLLKQGYRVILLDNRDAGLSQKFYALSAPPIWWALVKQKVGITPKPFYTLSDMASDAVGVLDTLNIQRAHIVGASMGGMIAQVFAAENPQRVRSLTSIMSSSGAPNLPEPAQAAVSALASGAESSLTLEGELDKRVEIARTIGSPRYFSETYARALAKRVVSRGTYPPGTVRQFLAILASGDRSPLLNKLQLPVLVIHGDADPLLPIAHGRDTAQKIPDAHFVAIRDMGHALEPAVSRLVLEQLIPFFDAVRAQPQISEVGR